MAEYKSIVSTCEEHPEEVAQVLCRSHFRLLCVSCAIEKAKASECSIIEIRKLSAAQDLLLIESLAAKQYAVNKKLVLDRQETCIESMKSSMEQEVLDVHFKLTKRLDKLKDDCLKTIETKTRAITIRHQHFKQRLASAENTLKHNVEQLSRSFVGDSLDNIKSNLEELKKELVNNIQGDELRPEGNFEPNDFLCSMLLRDDISLGLITIIDSDGYETVEEFPKPYLEDKTQEAYHSMHTDTNKFTKTEVYANISKPYTRPPLHVQLSSDEAGLSQDTEEGYLVPIRTDSCTKSVGKAKSAINPKHGSEKLCNTKQSGKSVHEERKTKSLFGRPCSRLFSNSKKSDKQNLMETCGITEETCIMDKYCTLSTRSDTENVYHGIELDSSPSITSEYFINTTVSIPGMRLQFNSACKFCKLVSLGGSRLGMLTKVHNSLVIVGLDRSIYSQKTMINGLVDIAAVGKDKVALLTENGQRICIVDVNKVGCSTVDCFTVHEDFQNVTGFDFDPSSSLFALSSPNKLIILDRSGKVVTSQTFYSTASKTNDIKSVYDFRKGRLYILNIENKTLKCMDVNKGDAAIWGCKYADSSFIARSMCLYNDTICIACRDCIIQLFAEDGSLFMKHDSHGLLEDCLGVCVIDDVIVFTSNSNDFVKSAKLAYRKLI